MRVYVGACVGLALGFGAAAAPGLKGPPPAGADLAGEWVCEERLIGGRPDPNVAKDRPRFAVSAGQWRVWGATDWGNSSPLELNPAADPPELTVRGRGDPLTGIYRLDGDTLTVCYVLGSGARPTAFTSPPDTPIRLMVLRRVKDK